MEGIETLTEAIERLSKLGFADNLRASNGHLIISKGELETRPEDYIVAEIVRFEGDTNLEDESILFALKHKTLEIKGLYAVAFGPEMDTNDLEVVQKLGVPKRS